jgi:MFS family permease
MDTWTLYALTMLPNIGNAAGLVAILFGTAGGIMLFFGHVEDINGLKKLAIWLLAVAFISLIVTTLIPTDKQMAIILGGKYLTNSEFSKVPDDVAIVLRKLLKKAAED